MAFKITSCTFIIRSSSAAEIARLVSKPKRLQSLFQKRTNTVLITPDIYRANDTIFFNLMSIFAISRIIAIRTLLEGA
jgi:hypothetical protein